MTRTLRDRGRVVFVTNIPSPYQIDFCNAAEHERPGALHVVFCAPAESNRSFSPLQESSVRFSHDVLQSRGRRWLVDWHRNPGLRARLLELDGQLVVVGGSYFMPDARTARNVAATRRRPWVYWGEHPFKKGNRGLRDWLKRKYLRWFLSSAAGAIGIGQAAAAAYGPFLPAGGLLESIPYAPDLLPLLRPSPELITRAAQLRARWLGGQSHGRIILFSGALVDRKAPDLLLEAFAGVSSSDSRLVFVGDGELRERLHGMAERLSVARRCVFAGFLRGDDLRSAYLAADLFVLPSRWHEGWGVVVQEAMAAGAATVVSDLVGAGADLIAHECTGLQFRADDASELRITLARLLADEAFSRRLGAAGREKVRSTSADVAAGRFWAVVDRLTAPRREQRTRSSSDATALESVLAGSTGSGR